MRDGLSSQSPLYLVVGARPNFVKAAPLIRVLKRERRIPFRLIHTGQHYDHSLSGEFFEFLELPDPDVSLEVGSGTHGYQTGRIMEEFEKIILRETPCAVVVFGDVNSTLACSVAAAKLQIPVAHVEAGLRSFDRTMPEEINRIITDVLSDILFVSEPSGLANLRREGIPQEKVNLVGNIMIDSLTFLLPRANECHSYERFGVEPGGYALLTMHRPSNVDDDNTLERLLKVFREISAKLPVIFPVHPRSRARMDSLAVRNDLNGRLILTPPVNYLDALCLQKNATVVFTDSGGMQEETAFLGVPCITLRDNTERPVTVERGTSTLVGNSAERIYSAFSEVLSGNYKRGQRIEYWDGKTAERISAVLAERFSG